MIEGFSPEAQKKLCYYVYRLVNPITGRTFYVGKGKGNRVFAHIKAANLEDFYNPHKNNYFSKDDKPTDEDDDPAKIKIIKNIHKHGLEVVHIIQRWGMDEDTAYEVESAFIDYFDDTLANEIQGHDSEKGMMPVDDLNTFLSTKPFDDKNCPYHYVLIKIKDYSIEKNGGNNPDGIYKTVRGYWRLDPNRANKYPYVLAVRYGIVVGVYKINENGWKYWEWNKKRAYFEGIEAPKEVQDYFINKRIPAKFSVKGRANPASYSD